mmetsp:Transcript_37130/g.98318  ORF Transcript_37130/g.98318 Transcript_37130/m.98318 type:complete len:230 (+) Transcript_37130:176-865(+)
MGRCSCLPSTLARRQAYQQYHECLAPFGIGGARSVAAVRNEMNSLGSTFSGSPIGACLTNAVCPWQKLLPIGAAHRGSAAGAFETGVMTGVLCLRVTTPAKLSCSVSGSTSSSLRQQAGSHLSTGALKRRRRRKMRRRTTTTVAIETIANSVSSPSSFSSNSLVGKFMPKIPLTSCPRPSAVADAVAMTSTLSSRLRAESSRKETNFSVPSMPYVSTSSSATVAPTSCK